MENNEEKRPIYKKWWFWLIIIIVICAIGASGENSEIKNPTKETTAIETKNTKVEVKKQEVEVIDFSQMSKDEIQTWCNENKVKANFWNEYSNTVEKGLYSSQKPVAGTKIYENDTITINYSLGKEPTLGEQNALKKAKSYLSYSSFSYKGLIKQLEFEGFSTEESTYAVDNCGADWNEQAAKKAKSYMDYSSFSKSSLIKQLEFEGFTSEQAQYGAKSVGY